MTNWRVVYFYGAEVIESLSIRRNGLRACTLACLLAAGIAPAAAAPSKPPRPVTAAAVEQRLSYLQTLMRSETGRRIQASGNAEAMELLEEARALMGQARAQTAADLAQASHTGDEALRRIMKAARIVAQPDDASAEEASYRDLRRSLDVFRDAHRRSAALFGARADVKVVGYDVSKVNQLIAQADASAGAKRYAEANVSLKQAQAIVTTALQGTLNKQTLVAELHYDTPEAQYDYEYRRYMGYEELVPVAIEMLHPPFDLTKALLETATRARAMVNEAERRAGANDYPLALRMLLDATQELHNALRNAGVSM